MKTEKISNCNNINYTARRIAVSEIDVNGKKEALNIYKLDEKDSKFLKVILDSVSLKKFVPETPDKQSLWKWQTVISDAGMYLGELPDEHSYLAVKNRKACGILIGTNDGKHGFIETLAKWPTKAGEKIKGIGKALMTPFIEDVSKTASEEIKLEPLSSSPYDCIKFYKKQRFAFTDNTKSCMEIKKDKMSDTVKENMKIIHYTPKNEGYEDISKIIDFSV